jgi:two-component system, NarL family, sensor histidine kinase EvgS
VCSVLNLSVCSLIVALLIDFFLPQTATAQGYVEAVNLTQDEKHWIKEKPVIRLGFNPDDPLTLQEREWVNTHSPIKFGILTGIEPIAIVAKNGDLSGIAIEINHLLQEALQIEIDVELQHWDLVADKVSRNEIDGLLSVTLPRAEQNKMLMSTTQHKTSLIIFARANAPFKITRWEDLSGKRIAYPRSRLIIQKKVEVFRASSEMIPVADSVDGLKRVLTNQADVYVGSSLDIYHMIKYGLSGIHPVFIDFDNQIPVGIAVRKDWPELVKIINKGLVLIGEQRLNAIYNKWMNQDFSAQEKLITAQEREWLKTLPPLTVAISDHRAPIEYIDENGKFSGMVVDYTRIIGERLGLRFIPVPHANANMSQHVHDSQHLDMGFSMPENHPNAENLSTTQSYMKIPLIVLVRMDKAIIQSLDELRGLSMAVIRNSAGQFYMQRDYPDLNLMIVDTVEQGINHVVKGKAYALLNDSVSTDYYLRKLGLTELKIAYSTSYHYELKIAVRNELSELIPLLDKALIGFTNQEKKLIFDKWVNQPITSEIDWRAFTGWLVLIASLITIFVVTIIYWNRRLAAEVVSRRSIQVELESAKLKAESANRAKSDFLANISHEIRTPMNAILGFSELLQRDAQLSQEHQSLLDIINNAGNYLLALINNVLDISKIEAGQMSLFITDVEIKSLLLDLENMFKFRAGEKGLALTFTGVDSLPDFIKIDEGKFRQILINLIGNAVKFTQEGQITCRVNCSYVRADRRKLSIEVEDTGIGIDVDESDKVFSTFGQAGSGERIEGGTGLGLAISREFARLMGGDIGFTSVVGLGSCFSLNLDVSIGHIVSGEESQREIIAVKSGVSAARILLADDVEDNRLLVKQILEPIGMTVVEAKDGQQAVDQFAQEKVDLILMDIHMPVLDGLKATQIIKKDPSRGHIPIIAMTASAFEEEKVAILEHGVDGFLRKPFKRDELLEIVGRVLGLKYEYKQRTTEPNLAATLNSETLSNEMLSNETLSNNSQNKKSAIARSLSLVGGNEANGALAKVLVVDDVQVNRMLLVKVLDSEGYRCKEAVNGKQALEFINTWHPDIVLLDVQMPVMNGYEVLQNVRKHHLTKNIPIVGVTADNDPAVINKLKELGAVDVLCKPVVTKQLRYVVKEHVKRASYRAAT